MQEFKDQNLKVSCENYFDALRDKKDFYIEFVTLKKEAEIVFLRIVTSILSEVDKLFIKDPVVTILKELITNATKANIKRLYFRQKKLQITDKNDYIEGMEKFKKECLFENAPIFDEIAQTKLRVRVYFYLSGEFPVIKVANNIPMVKEELDKINARISKAYRYNDISEAFADVLDDSEGAGLGLIMALMVFKNSGFAREDFNINITDTSTEISIKLSEKSGQQKLKQSLADEITKELAYLPSFPENIKRLEELCDLPDTSIVEIAAYVKTDPGLTSSILKQANSAGYLTSTRVDSIETAVKIIGLSGTKSLAMAAGVDAIIDEKYSQYKSIWDESSLKATYASLLAKKTGHQKLADKAYLVALISKIGEIALLSARKEAVENIRTLAGLKNLTHTDMLEEMTLGISHPTLSSIITERWNFDKEITMALKYHTRPHIAPEEIATLVNIVYIAHVLIEYELRRIRFGSIDYESLRCLNIENEEQFAVIHKKLKESIETEE